MLGLMQAPAQPWFPQDDRQVCVAVGMCVVDTCFVHQGLCPGVCVGWGGPHAQHHLRQQITTVVLQLQAGWIEGTPVVVDNTCGAVTDLCTHYCAWD